MMIKKRQCLPQVYGVPCADEGAGGKELKQAEEEETSRNNDSYRE